MVIGRRISSTTYQRVYGESDNFGVSVYLNLVNFGIKPHLDSAHFPNKRAEMLDKVVNNLGFPSYGLRDDSAIVINGTEQKLLAASRTELTKH